MKNYDVARQYFLDHDERCKVWTSLGIKWVLHHKDPSWRHTDIERYEQWNVEDLLPMTKSAHDVIHHVRQNLSEDTLRKMSNFQRGKYVSEKTRKRMSENHADVSGANNPNYGKKHPGKNWYNNGTEEILATECREGYVSGRLPGQKRNKRKE